MEKEILTEHGLFRWLCAEVSVNEMTHHVSCVVDCASVRSIGRCSCLSALVAVDCETSYRSHVAVDVVATGNQKKQTFAFWE